MLKDGFQRGLILLAGFILSLHSVVPHVHGPAPLGSETVTINDSPTPGNDLLAILQDFFTQTDLGEDHLEHFSNDQDTTPGPVLTAVLPPVGLPIIVPAPPTEPVPVRQQRVFRNRLIPPSGVYPDTTAPRGPPTFV